MLVPKESDLPRLDLKNARNSGRATDMLFSKRPRWAWERLKSMMISPALWRPFRELKRLGALAAIFIIVFNIFAALSEGFQLKNTVQSQGNKGYEALVQGIDSLKQKSLTDARNFFQQAEIAFHTSTDQLAALEISTRNEKFAGSLLSLAYDFSVLGEDLAYIGDEYLDIFARYKDHLTAELDRAVLKKDTKLAATTNFTDMIKQDAAVLAEADTRLARIVTSLASMDSASVPNEIQSKLAEAQQNLQLVYALNKKANEYLPTALDLLGDSKPHRYLVMFQNTHEIRPSGGFMGSYLVFTLDKGSFSQFEFHDIYDADGQVKDQIPAPEGLTHVTPLFSLRDANYYADFSESAEKIMWFYQRAMKQEVDTVIAIDQNVLFDLFSFVGTVDLPGYPVTIDGDTLIVNGKHLPVNNESLTMLFSYIVESHLTDSRTPKQVLNDLLPIIVSKAQDTLGPREMWHLLTREIEGRHLQAYSRYASLQNAIELAQMDGDLHKNQAPHDYLAVVDTSISGNKSTFDQHITHKTWLAENGSVESKVHIVRKHFWSQEKNTLLRELNRALGVKKLALPKLTKILGKDAYKTYLRIYLPHNITFKHISGLNQLEVEETDYHTIVKGYPDPLYPNEEQFINISYELPLPLPAKFSPEYRLLVQKQPGRRGDVLTKVFKTAEGILIQESAEDTVVDQDLHTAFVTEKLRGDKEFVVRVGE